MKRNKTRSVTTIEVVRERWENIESNIEFPILRPKTNATPQEPVAEEPQIEGILYENGILKEEVQPLWKELEIWKEACKKQVEKRLHTLVEVADELEGSPPDEEGDELDKVVFPEHGEIFDQSGYKFIVRAFVEQRLAQVTEEEKEAPAVELKGEDEPEFEMIPDLELGKDEQMQSRPSRGAEVFLY